MDGQRRSLASDNDDNKVQHHPDVSDIMLLQNPLKQQIGNNGTINNSSLTLQDPTQLFNPNPTFTSMAIIILIHLLWLQQWNTRKRPNKASYKIVVENRQVHKLWVAVLSHPPSRRSRTDDNNTNDEGDWQRQLVAQIKQLASQAYQSGFLLVLYNSHILWSCRSLEALYINGQDDTIETHPHQYARVLFALMGVALLLEFQGSFHLLKISRKLEGRSHALTIFPIRRNTTTGRMQQKILHRPVGTLTALSTALVVVFQHHFEYVPLQVLPGVDNRRWLLGYSLPAGLSSLVCWGILGYLSYPTCPLAPVLCGLASGILWAIGLTSFLQQPYWGNSVLAAFLLLCALSIRATHPSSEGLRSPPTYIPCIDFVAPSYSGRRDPDEANTATHTDNDSSDEEEEDSESSYSSSHREEEEEDNSNEEDLEMAPLLESRQTVRARRGVSNVG